MSTIESQNTVSSQLAMERSGHEAFAESRRYAYLPRESYLDILDRHLTESESAPLVVHAPSGVGKSALLAFWAARHRERHPGAFVVEHYVGNGSSPDHVSVIRHVLMEIRERYDLREDLPSTPEGLESAFAAWLWYVREDDPMILLIDALNQVKTRDPGIDWLPERLPDSVRMVISTTDPSTVGQLVARGWSATSLAPFTLKERQQVVDRFMTERASAITSEQAHGVAKAAGSANPLLLRTRLEEVGRTPHNAETRDTIAYYLGARDLDELHERMLARLEEEFDEALVSTILPVVHLSRGGVERDRLARIVARDHRDVDRLIDRLSFHFIEREGRLGYVHEYLRGAIERRYLADPRRARELRERLVSDLLLPPITTQVALEAAHQLSILQDDLRLRDYLADIDVVMAMQTGEAMYEFLTHWRSLSEKHDIVEVYRQSVDRYRAMREEGPEIFRVLNTLGILMENVGRLEGARRMQEDALALAERIEDPSAIARAAGDLGMICYHQGKHDRAMEYYQLQYTICDKLEDEAGLAPVLSRMAAIHFRRKEFDSAQSLTLRRLDISTRLNDRRGIALCYGGLASICHSLDEKEKARDHFERQLEISREIGDRRLIALTLGNLGVVLSSLGMGDRAEECFQEQLRITEEIGDRIGVASAMAHLGDVWKAAGRTDDALSAYRTQLAIAREIGDPSKVHPAFSSIVILLKEKNDPELRAILLDWMEVAQKDARADAVAEAAEHLALLDTREGNLDDAEKWQRIADEGVNQ